jgi:DNA-directed RNA polymerase specialized sigma24 family protein
MRSEISSDDFSADTLQERCASWKPGTRAKGKSRAEKIENMLGKLTDEERSALLERYIDSEE